jgi:hypothetical protein
VGELLTTAVCTGAALGLNSLLSVTTREVELTRTRRTLPPPSSGDATSSAVTRVFDLPRLRLRLRVRTFVLPLLELRFIPRSWRSSGFDDAFIPGSADVRERSPDPLAARFDILPERGRRGCFVFERPCDEIERSSSSHSAERAVSWNSLREEMSSNQQKTREADRESTCETSRGFSTGWEMSSSNIEEGTNFTI